VFQNTEFINCLLTQVLNSFTKTQNRGLQKKARSRKLIESLNRTLRRYVERVGWDTLKELDVLIDDFVETYNNTRHTSTKKVPNEVVAIEKKKDVREESKRQLKEKQKKIGNSKGFVKPPLDVGDNVRLYDPKRQEIKDEQKKKLKGKIKLSEADYVKQYTSSHRGNEAHWTKQVYMVTKVIVGTRAPRYKVKGKDDVYLRSELQKVRRVTKKEMGRQDARPKQNGETRCKTK